MIAPDISKETVIVRLTMSASRFFDNKNPIDFGIYIRHYGTRWNDEIGDFTVTLALETDPLNALRLKLQYDGT